MFSKSVIVIGVFATAMLLFLPGTARAHHEAMFGPQSSAVLSPGMFISLQMFDREDGKGGYRHRETTSVYSLGVKPWANPLSFAVVTANTREAYTYQGSSTLFEDPLISARYRVEAPGVAKALGVQESYVMGVGGLEVPLGNKDHAAGHGPFGEIAAGLFSIEKRPLAGSPTPIIITPEITTTAWWLRSMARTSRSPNKTETSSPAPALLTHRSTTML